MDYEEAIKQNKLKWQALFKQRLSKMQDEGKKVDEDVIEKLINWANEPNIEEIESHKRIYLFELFSDYLEKEQYRDEVNNRPIQDTEEDKIAHEKLDDAINDIKIIREMLGEKV